MSVGYAEIAITSVLNSEKSFCKFLSANDTGATGAHQSGILISKTAMEMLFSREQLEQEGIPKRTVKIKWQNDFETESCFTYYASCIFFCFSFLSLRIHHYYILRRGFRFEVL